MHHDHYEFQCYDLYNKNYHAISGLNTFCKYLAAGWRKTKVNQFQFICVKQSFKKATFLLKPMPLKENELHDYYEIVYTIF